MRYTEVIAGSPRLPSGRRPWGQPWNPPVRLAAPVRPFQIVRESARSDPARRVWIRDGRSRCQALGLLEQQRRPRAPDLRPGSNRQPGVRFELVQHRPACASCGYAAPGRLREVGSCPDCGHPDPAGDHARSPNPDVTLGLLNASSLRPGDRRSARNPSDPGDASGDGSWSEVQAGVVLLDASRELRPFDHVLENRERLR